MFLAILKCEKINVVSNIMNTKTFLEEKIHKVTKIDKKYIDLEVPNVDLHGDYSWNYALIQSKDEKKNPKEIADELVQKLSDSLDSLEMVEKIEVAGPGFINFFLKTDYLIKEMQNVSTDGDSYGNSDFNKGKTAIVEHSSPNIAKPFTIGHLRSTIIGDAVANLLEATGWKVMRDNHIGDWGTQFGKQIYAIKTWGDESEIEKSNNPVKDLVELYVRFHKEADKDPELEDKGRWWFKRLEDGDEEEARILWNKCINWSWKEFSRIYKLLDVKFSGEFDDGRGMGESFFEDKMDVVIEELEKKGLLKEGEGGAKLVFFKDDKYPPAMILKKDGATLYHTRDLATDKYRLDKYKPDLIINEVGAEQTLYFRQLFEMEKMLGWLNKTQRVHIPHGLIRFNEGKMSTRKGNVIWLEEVLNEAEERAKKLGSETDELAMIVGIGALKYNDLKRDPKSAIIFNWEEVLNMQGNSGPYIQYTYARTQSVLRKAQKNGEIYGLALSRGVSEEELSLLRVIPKFTETLEIASKTYSPNLLCTYLYELAGKYNSFYNKEKIIGAEKEGFRVGMTRATGQILKNGLKLLGIKAPKKM